MPSVRVAGIRAEDRALRLALSRCMLQLSAAELPSRRNRFGESPTRIAADRTLCVSAEPAHDTTHALLALAIIAAFASAGYLAAGAPRWRRECGAADRAAIDRARLPFGRAGDALEPRE